MTRHRILTPTGLMYLVRTGNAEGPRHWRFGPTDRPRVRGRLGLSGQRVDPVRFGGWWRWTC